MKGLPLDSNIGISKFADENNNKNKDSKNKDEQQPNEEQPNNEKEPDEEPEKWYNKLWMEWKKKMLRGCSNAYYYKFSRNQLLYTLLFLLYAYYKLTGEEKYGRKEDLLRLLANNEVEKLIFLKK